jgi:hypothetical protein
MYFLLWQISSLAYKALLDIFKLIGTKSKQTNLQGLKPKNIIVAGTNMIFKSTLV